MKSLEFMNYHDRAKLLHQLFPGHMRELIEFMAGMSDAIKDSKEQNEREWKDEDMSFDQWYGLVLTAADRIEQHRKQLYKRHNLFAVQLFDGVIALFSVHCLRTYVSVKKHSDKFPSAVRLLFD